MIVSLRSPMPLLLGGVCVALLVIAAVSFLSQPPAAGQEPPESIPDPPTHRQPGRAREVGRQPPDQH